MPTLHPTITFRDTRDSDPATDPHLKRFGTRAPALHPCLLSGTAGPVSQCYRGTTAAPCQVSHGSGSIIARFLLKRANPEHSTVIMTQLSIHHLIYTHRHHSPTIQAINPFARVDHLVFKPLSSSSVLQGQTSVIPPQRRWEPENGNPNSLSPPE